MNFLEQRQELATQLGLDQTMSDTDTRLKRWLNMGQRLIIGAYPWPFLRASYPLIVQTVPDYTTGTITTTAGSSTVTFSGTIAASKTGYYLQTSSSSDWYRITAHTAGTATATIDPEAIYDSTATTTFIVRKIYYSLSSDVDRVISIKQSVFPYKLNEMTREMLDSMNLANNTTGNPTNFMMVGKDSSDIWQFTLWPNPSSVMNLQVEYLKTVDDLSGDSDISVIPSKWNSVIMIQAGKMFGFDWLDDTRSTESKTLFYKMLEDMKMELMPSKSMARCFRGVDESSVINEYPYPSSYPYGS